VDRAGNRFAFAADRRGELAPRDIVARAVEEADADGGAWLDARHLPDFPTAFPGIHAMLREHGLDPAQDLIPVAPALHYAMGGICTDLDGRSSLPGLWAAGEVARTGVHGANRLASNSLSECFVFAARAVADALHGAGGPPPAVDSARAETLRALPAPPHAGRHIREALWREAGIVRTAQGLERLLVLEYPLAGLIARCALERRESRGAHLRADYPERDPALEGRHVVLEAGGELGWQTWS